MMRIKTMQIAILKIVITTTHHFESLHHTCRPETFNFIFPYTLPSFMHITIPHWLSIL